jgi:hypothetical protein
MDVVVVFSAQAFWLFATLVYPARFVVEVASLAKPA